MSSIDLRRCCYRLRWQASRQTTPFRRSSRRFRSEQALLTIWHGYSLSLIFYIQSAHQLSIIMGLTQWPTQDQYLEAERESKKPAAPPTNPPLGPIKIRWLTPSNYPGGRVWNMEELTLRPNERIFDQKIFEEDKVYWSQDTRTHLTSQATCASVSIIYARVNCLL